MSAVNYNVHSAGALFNDKIRWKKPFLRLSACTYMCLDLLVSQYFFAFIEKEGFKLLLGCLTKKKCASSPFREGQF